MEIIELTWLRLALSFLALAVPISILTYYGTGLTGKMGLAVGRMTLQLLFVGYYLEYLFAWNNPWINVGWILVMVVVADLATTERSELKRAPLFLPIFVSTLLGILLIDLFFLKFVIGLEQIMDAQYAIPITGMILGNCLRSNVIGINAFYYGLVSEQERYRFYLAAGATRNEALYPFVREALKKTANPTLASMMTVGIVSLPGMMTGQILSGSSPLIAIQYQIMIYIAIFTGTMLTVMLAIWLSNRRAFDEWNRFDRSILAEVEQ